MAATITKQSISPSDAVIVDFARTPMGRSKGGCFRYRRGDDLSAELISGILARNPAIDTETIDDVIWGCVMQSGDQGFNIARNSILRAGLPHSVPAQTVNRLCGSSMSALHQAVANIQSCLGHVYLVGGVEHMGRHPMGEGVDSNPLLNLSIAQASGSMGLTAEHLATLHQISREEQDAFAVQSHQRAAKATQAGTFKREILPCLGHDSQGAPVMVAHDETIRADTNETTLAGLKPVFDPVRGSVTAGNASQISDGASAVLILSAERAKQLEFDPIARVISMGITGVDPSVMGLGPVSASKQALDRAGMALEDMQALELNEAFAAQSLAVLKAMELSVNAQDKVNSCGGAIALGHPLGCSGTRIMGTLLNSMLEMDVQWGLATLCVGLGQGLATVVERV